MAGPTPPPASPRPYDTFDPFYFHAPFSAAEAHLDLVRSTARRRSLRRPIFADGDPARRPGARVISDSPPQRRASFTVPPSEVAAAASAAASEDALAFISAASSDAVAASEDAYIAAASSSSAYSAAAAYISDASSDAGAAASSSNAYIAAAASDAVAASEDAYIAAASEDAYIAAASAPASSTASTSAGRREAPVAPAAASARGRGRARGSGRPRRRARRCRRASPEIPAGNLAPSNGPAEGQTVDEFVWERLCDLNEEYERLDEGRLNIKRFADVPYARTDRVAEAWAKFSARVAVCRTVRDEIRAVKRWVDDIPEEFSP